MIPIELSKRQEQILKIVQERGPITGDQIAEHLHLTRATLRPDLAILTMSGFLEARPRVGYFYTGKTGNRLLSEHIRKLKVKDYKAPPVVVHEQSSVYEAIVTLFLEDVGTLYVLNKDNLLAGVVSRKDLLRTSLGNKNLEDVPVGIIMTRMPNVITVGPEDSIFEAANKLIENQIDSLPVVIPVEGMKNALQVVGRCTKTTIARAFVQMGKEEVI
ncbi:negative regulator of gluconeogenesis [[Clostridium] ultunense Esp]|uniref:helix-turn-helix transcriptional regulator n=1 Tax=Thermicanus aegyptius TaxID=94009 RepID=UPI0002B6F026|nr:helix-turn-helix transcriptional regulator [Thermicanus aegyptius]CCQ96082.1 negative regulator of gluconeogenesis [[Clostridium] ultunense Esp]